MSPLLDEEAFTHNLVNRLSGYKLNISVPEPLSVAVDYGTEETILTMKLEDSYKRYVEQPDQLDSLLVPFVTEIGWTTAEPRHATAQILTSIVPWMRNLVTEPLPALTGDGSSPGAVAKGPYLIQDLLVDEFEHIAVQYSMLNSGDPIPLHRGDTLPCLPESVQVSGQALSNLKRIVLENELSLNEVPVEGFKARFWKIELPGTAYVELSASLLVLREAMHEIQKSFDSADGLIAIVPSRDCAMVSPDLDDASVCEAGLLAEFLRSKARWPMSRLVWRFKDGVLEKMHTVELDETAGTTENGDEDVEGASEREIKVEDHD